MIRFLIAMLLSVFCLSPMRAEAAVQEKNKAPVSMEVSYGFGDTARPDRHLKVDVKLSASEETDFSGTVQILTTESSLEVYRYDYPAAVHAGEEALLTCYIPLGIKTGEFFVIVVDESGNELVRKRVKLNLSDDVTDSFMGVFCDDPEALSYLDNVGIHYGSLRTRQVMLDSALAPEDALGYEQLDLIVISGYDMDRLSPRQREAVSLWVENGGTLLLGGAEAVESYDRTLFSQPPAEARMMPVNFGVEYSEHRPQESVLELSCWDMDLKNGGILLSGDTIPLLSYVHWGDGRIVASAFRLEDIGEFCAVHPTFAERLLTLTLGEDRVMELSQMEYTGFSRLYFSIQGLVNTGSMDRLPNVLLYTAVIVVYLLLLGPGIYLYLRKRERHRYYMIGASACALIFTAVIYVMGMGTRFQEPFFTYAAIRDVSENGGGEDIYLNVRSPYNKPYSVRLAPGYTIRPVTKSYYYDSATATKFTGEEQYKTNLRFLPDSTEIRVRDTVAFTPKLFLLNRQRMKSGTEGIGGYVVSFGGELEGRVVNGFSCRLEDAILMLYGKAVLLGDLEPGQEVDLSECRILNYPPSYVYALVQLVTGGDQFEKTEIENADYIRAQERSRLLNFYLDSKMTGYTPEARVFAFAPQEEQEFLPEGEADGLTMVTASLEVERKKDGLISRPALSQEPSVLTGNYQAAYNSMYTGEPSEPAVIEYSLGNDLALEEIRFETLSPEFVGNARYPYLQEFQGEIYFYNHDTGRNDKMEPKDSYSARELRPYLSPSNTLTVKYVSIGGNENGWERQLPMIYAIGREK